MSRDETFGFFLLVDQTLPLRLIIRRYGLLLPALLFSGPARGGNVTVIRSDARSLVFEYRPVYSPLRPVNSPEGDFVIQDFDDAVQAASSATVGSPDLRYRVIPVAFPALRGNSVRVLAADYEDVRDARVAPVPAIRSKDNLTAATIYSTNAAQYGVRSFVPADVVELAPVERSRNILLGGVKVYPVQYNPADRVLRKYSRLVIEVTFGTSALPVRKPERLDPLLANVPLNASAAQTWAGAVSTAAIASSVLASGDWYRLTVADDGMYRLSAAFLSSIGINLSSFDPRTLKIYGNGGMEVPEDLQIARPVDLTENAIYVEGEADGKFDGSDFVIFYGRRTRGWSYDTASKRWVHSINHYSEVNYYWLTFGGTQGKRMAEQPSLPSSATDVIVERFTDGIAIEDEMRNILGSGKDWLGPSLGSGSSFTYVRNLPGLFPNDVIRYRYQLVSHSDVTATFTVKQNQSTLATHLLPPIYGYLEATAGTFASQGSSSISDGLDQLTFTYGAASAAPNGYIDWVEILYPRMLWGVNDSLRFHGPDTTAVIEYHLQQFGGLPMIFNVSSSTDPRLVTGVGGSYLFRASETTGSPSTYWAVAGGSWRTPQAAARIASQNLRGYADGADFVIVTSPEYRSAADRLKAYREDPVHGGLKTVVADVNLIYNEFGGGLPDITAIRDYLKYAYDNWTLRPRFVLILGQCSYDYKGLRGSRSSFVPIWESAESRDDVDSYCTDDFFAKFGGDNRISLVLGRVSARSTAEADAFVDKLQRYEQQSAADSWKMRMVFIGDDAWTSEGGEVGDGVIHSQDTENLAITAPEEFEKRKVYIAEYPTVWTSQGRRKPEANQAIIDQINQGGLVVAYSGHGNNRLLAHEDIFDVESSIPRLTNRDRLAMFFLATCNFSDIDDPETRTGSEYLINKQDGGGIAVISATRKVYEGANAALSSGTFRRMFLRNFFGGITVERPATALFQYKATGNVPNDQKFFYMGDPTMRLQYPGLFASIDSINGLGVDSVGGVPRTSPIQIRSLSVVNVDGMARDQNGLPDTTFQGIVVLTLNDATGTKTIANFSPGINWSYSATGGTIYRGGNSVHNGRFSATFMVPKDIQYSDSTARGRLVAYLSRLNDRTSDGAGYTGAIRVGGTDTLAANDHSGPSIGVFLGSRSFRAGDVVGEEPMLYIDLVDSSGINTSVSGIGHRIEAWVNNASQSRDLTEFYVSKLDNFREGTVAVQLTGLPEGRNSLRVRAWDSFDNSASAETFFQIASTEQLSIADVFNYPNPFGGQGTAFTFRQNQSVPLLVTVKVFTLAGRLIRSIDASSAGDSFIHVPWDGRDSDGDVIANGVYLYKLVVRTVDGRFSSEVLGKLSKIQ
jgi:hypothetical protein